MVNHERVQKFRTRARLNVVTVINNIGVMNVNGVRLSVREMKEIRAAVSSALKIDTSSRSVRPIKHLSTTEI